MIPVSVLAKLCAAAYEADATASVQALGFTHDGQVADNGCGILFAHNGVNGVIAFRGTDLDLLHWRELFDDSDCCSFRVCGHTVHDGFYGPLARHWPDIVVRSSSYGSVTVTGHSLGGARATLMPIFIPDARVVTFGAPAPAQAPYAPIVERYVHARDPVPDVPLAPWIQPGPLQWLNAGSIQVAARRPEFLDLDINDHMITQYIQALTAAGIP